MECVLERIRQAKAEHHATRQTPFICATWAQSLDGFISAAPGVQTTVSCAETFELAHEIRACHDAILVGIGTLLVDNPRLNARLSHPVESPCPVILDSNLRTPPTARFLQLQRARRPFIFCTRHAFDRAKETNSYVRLSELATIIPMQNPPGHTIDGLHLPTVFKKLYDNNLRSIMIEGGGKILRSVLSGCHANYVVVSVTPRLFGGGVSIFTAQDDGKRHNSMVPVVESAWRTVGSDVVLSGQPA